MKHESYNKALQDLIDNSYKSLVTAQATVKKFEEGLIEVKEDDLIRLQQLEQTKEAIGKIEKEIDMLEGMKQ